MLEVSKVLIEAEKIDLSEKLEKLRNFIKSDKIKTLESNQFTLLVLQEKTMDMYKKILTDRLNLILLNEDVD